MRDRRGMAMAVALFGAGLMFGAATDWTSSALGEVRSGPAPQAFQSGGQRSVPILREISATLQQMDERLARIELVAKQLDVRGDARNARSAR